MLSDERKRLTGSEIPALPTASPLPDANTDHFGEAQRKQQTWDLSEALHFLLGFLC